MCNNGANPGYGNLFMITQDRKNIKAAGYQWYWNLGYGHYSDQVSAATYPGSRATTGQYCQFDTALDSDEYFAYVVRNHASAVAVTTKGRLYFTGYNGFGQFGFGDTTNRFIFTRSTYFGPTTGRTAVDVKIGKIFSGSDGLTTPFLVRTSEGEMYGAGYNGAGLLGQNDTTNRTSWTPLNGASPMTESSSHLLTTILDGSVAMAANASPSPRSTRTRRAFALICRPAPRGEIPCARSRTWTS